MPVIVQILNHTVGRCHIINRHAGQIGNLQAGGAVGQQHTGDAQAFQLGRKILKVGAQKHNAVGLALGADTPGLRDLVGFLVDIVDSGYITAVGNLALQLLQNICEQHILGALYDQDNAVICLLL